MTDAPITTLPLLGDKLRKLAKSVRSIGYGRRDSAEDVMLQKDEIASELDKLATMVGGGRP